LFAGEEITHNIMQFFTSERCILRVGEIIAGVGEQLTENVQRRILAAAAIALVIANLHHDCGCFCFVSEGPQEAKTFNSDM
jgi:hypothetical protein